MRYLIVAVCFLLCGAGCGQSSGSSPADPDGGQPPITPSACLADPACRIPLVSAHRGSCGSGPENSLASFLYCQQIGMPMIEIDTRETADGAVVLMHDSDVERTTDGETRYPGRTSVDQLSLVEFQALVFDASECAEDPDAKPETCHPPTLQQVLSRTGPELILFIDFKTGRVAEVARLVKEANAADRVVLFDVDLDNLRAYRQVIPDGIVLPRATSAEDCRDFLGAEMADLDLTWIHGDPGYAAEADEILRPAGVRLYVDGFALVDPYLALAEMSDDVQVRQSNLQRAHEAIDALIETGAMGLGAEYAHLWAEYLYPKGFGR